MESRIVEKGWQLFLKGLKKKTKLFCFVEPRSIQELEILLGSTEDGAK